MGCASSSCRQRLEQNQKYFDEMMISHRTNTETMRKNADSMYIQAVALGKFANVTVNMEARNAQLQEEVNLANEEKMDEMEEELRQLREIEAEMKEKDSKKNGEIVNLKMFLSKQSKILQQANDDIMKLRQIAEKLEKDKLESSQRFEQEMDDIETAYVLQAVRVIALKKALVEMDTANKEKIKQIIEGEITKNDEMNAAAGKIVRLIEEPDMVDKFNEMSKAEKLKEIFDLKNALQVIESAVAKNNLLLATELENLIEDFHVKVREATWSNCHQDLCPSDLWTRGIDKQFMDLVDVRNNSLPENLLEDLNIDEEDIEEYINMISMWGNENGTTNGTVRGDRSRRWLQNSKYDADPQDYLCDRTTFIVIPILLAIILVLTFINAALTLKKCKKVEQEEFKGQRNENERAVFLN